MTHILLHILLSCHNSTLADLEPHLRRRVVHEAAKCRMHVSPSILLTTVSVARVLLLLWWLLLLLLLRDQRRRRAQLRDGGDMLWDRVMERRRVRNGGIGICRSVHDRKGNPLVELR